LLNCASGCDPAPAKESRHIMALVFMRGDDRCWFVERRDWNDKGLHENVERGRLAAYTKLHRKWHGGLRPEDDHRSYRDRGIDLLPQPKKTGERMLRRWPSARVFY